MRGGRVCRILAAHTPPAFFGEKNMENETLTNENFVLPEADLFGGEFKPQPESRFLVRLSLRLTPEQKRKFFEYASGVSSSPSELLRDYVLHLIGEA